MLMSETPFLWQIPLALVGGAVLGLLYFRAVELSAQQLCAPGPKAAWWRIVLPLLGRWALAIGVFAAAAQGGAITLLSCFGGFLVVRVWRLRAARRDIDTSAGAPSAAAGSAGGPT